jgi:hypothetical protein
LFLIHEFRPREYVPPLSKSGGRLQGKLAAAGGIAEGPRLAAAYKISDIR